VKPASAVRRTVLMPASFYFGVPIALGASSPRKESNIYARRSFWAGEKEWRRSARLFRQARRSSCPQPSVRKLHFSGRSYNVLSLTAHGSPAVAPVQERTRILFSQVCGGVDHAYARQAEDITPTRPRSHKAAHAGNQGGHQ